MLGEGYSQDGRREVSDEIVRSGTHIATIPVGVPLSIPWQRVRQTILGSKGDNLIFIKDKAGDNVLVEYRARGSLGNPEFRVTSKSQNASLPAVTLIKDLIVQKQSEIEELIRSGIRVHRNFQKPEEEVGSADLRAALLGFNERIAYQSWERHVKHPWYTGLVLSTWGESTTMELWLPGDFNVYNIRDALSRRHFENTGALWEFTVHLTPQTPPLACLLTLTQIEERAHPVSDTSMLHCLHYEGHRCRCHTPPQVTMDAIADSGSPCRACTMFQARTSTQAQGSRNAQEGSQQYREDLCCSASRGCWHKHSEDNSLTGWGHGPHDHRFCFNQLCLSSGQIRHFQITREYCPSEEAADEVAMPIEDQTCLCCWEWIPPLFNWRPQGVDDLQYIPPADPGSDRLYRPTSSHRFSADQLIRRWEVWRQSNKGQSELTWMLALKRLSPETYELCRERILSYTTRPWRPELYGIASSFSGASTMCWRKDSLWDGLLEDEGYSHTQASRLPRASKIFLREGKKAKWEGIEELEWDHRCRAYGSWEKFSALCKQKANASKTSQEHSALTTPMPSLLPPPNSLHCTTGASMSSRPRLTPCSLALYSLPRAL
jgi:hypothetical protein